MPFNRLLEKLAILTVPDSPSDKKQENTLLDERLLTTPSVAVGRAMLTGGDMAEICRTSLLQAMSTTRVWNDAIADEVIRKEDAVDHYEDVLGIYLVKLSAKHLSVEDNRSVNTLLHTIGDFERVSDHAVNIIKTAQEIRDKGIKFSEEALNDLSVLEAAVQDIVNRTVDAFQKCDTYAAGKIEPLEQVVDGLVREARLERLIVPSSLYLFGLLILLERSILCEIFWIFFSYWIAFGASSSNTQASSETPAIVETPGSIPIVDVPIETLVGAAPLTTISA